MPKVKIDEFESRNLKGTIRFFLWTLVWVASLVLIDKAILYDWVSSFYVIAAGILLNAAMGVGVIWAFLRYLRNLDEMQRKIQMESLALAMGITLVSSFTYTLLVTAGVIADPEVSDIILIMAITYMLGVTAGQVRYR